MRLPCMHGAVWEYFSAETYDLPVDEPLSLASYEAEDPPEAYVEHASVGRELPNMPLFLGWERYVGVPFERTYQTAFQGRPAYWRGVLEGRSPGDVQ